MVNATVDPHLAFHTGRYAMVPATPALTRHLVENFLLHDVVAASLPWLIDGTTRDVDGIIQILEAMLERGLCKVWGITARRDRAIVGMLIARNDEEGLDVTVLIRPAFAACAATDEVCKRMRQWLEEQGDRIWGEPVTLH